MGGTVKPLTLKSVAKPNLKALPGRIESFFRMGGTIKLINALMRDARVPAARKVGFSVALFSLLAAMIFPELMADSILSTILPFISTIIGIPLEAGVDWLTFVMVLPMLLRIFPATIMQEHYLRIFQKKQFAAMQAAKNPMDQPVIELSHPVFEAQV
jgi:hypothetical protein